MLWEALEAKTPKPILLEAKEELADNAVYVGAPSTLIHCFQCTAITESKLRLPAYAGLMSSPL